MMTPELGRLMSDKDDLARVAIAQRVGERLSAADLGEVDRRAAETLARVLVTDAAELVRRELSLAIRNAKYLPKDIARKIAHDVDMVACPFLEVTEVFTEEEWHQLVLTISRSALVAVARRSTMPEGLASLLAELGSQETVETLLDNKAAPMTVRICGTVIDRFDGEASVLDRMASRDDLIAEIAVTLSAKVAGAAREKLTKRYNLPDFTEVVGAEAEVGSTLRMIRVTPPLGLAALIRALRKDGKLTDLLLMKAAEDGLVEFLAVALSERGAGVVEQVRNDLLHAGTRSVVTMLARAKVSAALHDSFWSALTALRLKAGSRLH